MKRAVVFLFLFMIFACTQAPKKSPFVVNPLYEDGVFFETFLKNHSLPHAFSITESSQKFLKNILEKFIKQVSSQVDIHATIHVVNLSDPTVFHFSVPPMHVFFSKKFFSLIEFEQELTAVLALEFAHLWKRHLKERFLYFQKKKKKHVSLLKLSQWSAKQEEEALFTALSFLYQARYDPRGVNALLKKKISFFKSHHFQKKAQLFQNLLEKSQEWIQKHPPLIHPLEGAKEFKKFLLEMRSL